MTRAIGLGVAALLMAATHFEVESAEPCDPDLIPEARSVLNYLESMYGQKTLVGQQGSGEAEEAFEASGKWPAILGSDLCGWHKQRWSPQYQRIMQNAIDRAKQWHDKGGIVEFSWHWGNPLGDEGTMDSDKWNPKDWVAKVYLHEAYVTLDELSRLNEAQK